MKIHHAHFNGSDPLLFYALRRYTHTHTRTPTDTHTHTYTHMRTRTHTHTRAHTHTHHVCGIIEYRYIHVCRSSYTQYGNKPYAKYTRDHIHIHIYQLQLMPTWGSRSVLIVSPRNAVSSVCILLYMSSYIAGRRCPNSISRKFGFKLHVWGSPVL